MNTTPVTACNPSLHPMELENISFLYKLPPYDMDFEIVFLRFYLLDTFLAMILS